GPDRGDVRRRAGHLRAHRLPAAQLRPVRAGRARPGPVPGAVGRLLRALHAAGLAGPGAVAGAGSRGGPGGGDVRPAADPGGRRRVLTGARARGDPMTSLRELLSAPRYEVIPAKGTEQAVADWVPAGMTVTVTASPV